MFCISQIVCTVTYFYLLWCNIQNREELNGFLTTAVYFVNNLGRMTSSLLRKLSNNIKAEYTGWPKKVSHYQIIEQCIKSY